MPKTFVKDPDSIVDYKFDWSDYLGSDTIISYSVIVSSGIVVESDSNDGTSVTVFLSGGNAGADYDVTCRIVTGIGRTVDRSMVIELRER